ncbi:hypothetical protein ACP70R_024959 [Stipagrostis hirtigluma subsp. patula]
MVTTSPQSAAAAPKPQSPSTPTAQPGPDHPPPAAAAAAMTAAELEAAIAALPAKKDALREAFDRLAACSPHPLPFAWEDLDAHISSLQSSISLRFRQLRVLEAARRAPAVSGRGETLDEGKAENQDEEDAASEEEEWEEVEVEEEEVEVDGEMQEADDETDKKDDEEMKEASEEEEEEIEEEEVEEEEIEEEVEEVEEEAADDKIGSETKDDVEAAQEEEQDADEEMQEANKEQDAKKASQGKEEEDEVHEEQNASMEEEEETVAMKASPVRGKEKEVCGEKQEEKEEDQKAHKNEQASPVQEEEGANEEVVVKKVSQEQDSRAPTGGSKDIVGACASMDAQRLVKLMFSNVRLGQQFPIAIRHAPDAAALVLHVIELFLPNNMPKTGKVWLNCVGLIRSVPRVVAKPSADMIVQAKQVAKDWKEMIDNPGSCMVLGNLASWGLLNFLISYNIASEFDTKEIFHLFGTVPRKQKKKNPVELFKGLGLTNRITELIDYLIGNGQQLEVLHLAHVFNLVDKYPPLSLLKGYVEKAKQTAMEISRKNMKCKSLSAEILMEADNLRIAHTLVKQHITDSSLCTGLRAEINVLLDEYAKKKQSLANASTASTSGSQQQQKQSNKKRKKEEQEPDYHKGQKRQHQGQQSKPGEKPEQRQNIPQHKQQQQQQKQETKPQEKQQQQKQETKPQEKQQKLKQETKPHDKQQQQNQETKPQERQQQQKQENKPQEKQQQYLKQSRQQAPKLPKPAVSSVRNSAQIGHFVHPPYATVPLVHGHPAELGWPAVPPYIPPPFDFDPFYHHPHFYPR